MMEIMSKSLYNALFVDNTQNDNEEKIKDKMAKIAS
jgi:hypothetical protein